MEQIYELLARVRPEADYRGSADYLADGLLDSFDIVTLVADLDQAFGVSIPGTEIVPDNFRDAAAIRRLVDRCPSNRR